jgi:hypothetical protein
LSNKRKRGATSVASARTLAKLVFSSIDTTKVTQDWTENWSNGKEEGSNDDKNPNAIKKVAIEGMHIVAKEQKKAMLFDTA